MEELERVLAPLEPGEALARLLPVMGRIMAHLDEEARINWVRELLGGWSDDKLSGMVNL